MMFEDVEVHWIHLLVAEGVPLLDLISQSVVVVSVGRLG